MKDYKCTGYIFVDDTGKVISEILFDSIIHEVGDIYSITRFSDYHGNFFNIKTGKLFSNEWFLNTWSFHCGYALVSRNIQRSSPNWIYNDSEYRYHWDYWDREYNYINKEGNYLSDIWFINAYGFKDGIASITIVDCSIQFGFNYLMDINGNIILCTQKELEKFYKKRYK